MRNYKILVPLILVLLTFFGCQRNASDDSTESVEEVEARATEGDDTDKGAEQVSGDIERSLLWRIDGENGPVWLFGTIHGGVDASEWEGLPADIRQALEEAEVVVMEVDIDGAPTPAVMDRMMLPEGQRLSSKLSEEQWAALLEAAPVPEQAVDQFQPWVAYSLVLEGLLSDEATVDDSIQAHAEERGKEIEFLESVEEQLEALSAAIDAEILGELLDDPEEARRELDELTTAYKKGDAAAIEELVFDEEEMNDHAEMYELLFTERNIKWVSRIEDYLERGNVFVAGGAGHFLGEGSVIELLTDRGHEVERVPAPE